MEPRHHGVEYEANVRPGGRLKRPPSLRGVPLGTGMLADVAFVPQGLLNPSVTQVRHAIVCTCQDRHLSPTGC